MLAKILIPAALIAALPALAQTPAPTLDAQTQAQADYEKGYSDSSSPNAPAVNAVEGPVTDSLNASVAGNLAAANVANANLQGQYAIDVAQYQKAVNANNRATLRDEARYARQQRAYADAMQAWRIQVEECERVNIRACRAPTPNPADFY